VQPGHGLQQLADRIAEVKLQPNAPPYMLVVGAGCAQAASVKPLEELRASYGDDVDDPAALDAILWDLAVPPFYYDIANLARAGYLPRVVSTGYDRLLERALSDLGLRPGDQFDITELGAGEGLSSPIDAAAELRIVRAFGLDPADSTAPARLDAATGHMPGAPLQVVLVGYQGENTTIERWLGAASGGDLWWANPGDPDASHLGGSGWHGEVAIIEGEEASPEAFFGQLALVLLRIPAIDALKQSGSADERGDDWYNRQYTQNRLHQAKTVKRAIETGVSASSYDPAGQNQLTYQSQEIGRLEGDLVSSEAVDALLKRFLSTRTELSRRAERDPASVDVDTMSFVDGHIEALIREAKKPRPNPTVVAAAEASLQQVVGTLGIAPERPTAAS
jgi:hypothetical protein